MIGAGSDDRPPWEFGYSPIGAAAYERGADTAIVIATAEAVAAGVVERAIGIDGTRVETLLERAPIFWTGARLRGPRLASEIADRLRSAGISVRYAAPASRGSFGLGAPLARVGEVARPVAWRARRAVDAPADAPDAWFLQDGTGGVAVDRARFGRGEGTRLAVIDDDAAEAEGLDLDAEVLLGVEAPPRHHAHGALMVAWASGSRRASGVAPGTSARLYVIPKPGWGVSWVPIAIVRAVSDGADVVVCATYVEGSTSPMLDDALDFAARFGRRGRGAPVVMPTGREASSPPGSMRASFTLGLGEPACDPRVHCVAPGARGEGWFFWRDRRGRSRPFSNRGPAIRWLAPGDDIPYPFAAPGDRRFFHAESSGASAIAAGVMLLVIAACPTLRAAELAALLAATATPVAPGVPERQLPLADPADALPAGRDRDGHDAKHGYGRLDAGRACLAAVDPVAAALAAIGEDRAARAWIDARRADPAIGGAYSARLGRFLARRLLVDPIAAHAARALARHARLAAAREGRLAAHGSGALTRQIRILLRGVAAARPRPPPRVAAELAAIEARLAAIAEDPEAERSFEAAIDRIDRGVFIAPRLA